MQVFFGKNAKAMIVRLAEMWEKNNTFSHEIENHKK
nr:MAG TPA: hypothetical protein [Caudoviricetes sp.]DAP20376.1 MAG TPA: hypothetical protein [Caudoviricetes sp.]